MERQQGLKVKIRARILKYGPGKKPGIDDPDEIAEGAERESTLFGRDAEYVRKALKAKE
ncbi:MAG: hypothetical protein ACLFUL_06280 [Desulfobacteraceae bacterium]